jgi:hypothetical protein
MAKAKKDPQKKVKTVAAPAKLSKEMKADIEKMFEKSQKQTDKRFTAIENQLEKLKVGESKAKTKKAGTRAKPAQAKKKGATKKKMHPQDQEVE